MHWILFGLCITVSGCSSLLENETPRVRTHHTNPAGPLVQTLHVELERQAPVRVEYWTDTSQRLIVDSERAATHRIPLTRLRADQTYWYRIVGTEVGGAFTTESLPLDLARVLPTASGSPTTPLVLLHFFDPYGFRGYAVVDADGEIVWYWRTAEMALGATRRANGNAVFLDRGRGLVEVRPDGSVAHELPQDTVNREMHHDVIVTPRNTLLFLAFDQRPHAGEPMKGESVWEWNPEKGDAVKRWSSWDHLSPDKDRGTQSGVEWLHANSLALGERGNVLVSFRFLNQVISISPDFQRVEWRLGGVNPTRTLLSADQYSVQHTAGEPAANRLLVFDNGLDMRDSSRALELDLNAPQVKAVWQWRPERPNLSAFVGSARRLASGNTLVAFGMGAGRGSTGPVEVYEVTAKGRSVWHLEIGNTRQMFRAEPWHSIGSEYSKGSTNGRAAR